jgi:hypothetical protein
MSAVVELSRDHIQAQRIKCNTHENTPYTFPRGEGGTAFGVGDVGILHNLAILFKMKDIEEKYKNSINRFLVLSRTMRRSPHWDWVKPEHINLILAFLHEIHENIDAVVASFQQGQAYQLEQMEEQVALGVMAEGDYIAFAKGMKKPHEFITGSDFKRWVANRAEFYKTLNGKMPTLELIFIPHYNENDGKTIIIRA